MHAAADLASTTSPLAITGISTASTISLIWDQSDSPEYLWRRVRPCTQIRSTPAASILWQISKAVLGPLPVPNRIFTVIGMSAASMHARTISTTLSGLRSKAAPASLRQTLGAGQPKLRSIMSARSCNNFTVSTISSISPPKICGMNGDSLGSDSTLSHECLA